MIAILRPLKKENWSGLVRYRNCYEDLGPYYTRSGMIYTGLTPADEQRLGAILGQNLQRGSEYWKNFFVRTYSTDIFLNLEDPNDELRYLFLKNHKRVKTSIFERKASAHFLLINKEEEAKRSNLINKVRRTALKEFDSLTAEDIRKALRLFGQNGDNMEPEVAENKLFEIAESNPQSFIDRWINNTRRDTEVIIERAISMNIIRRAKNIYRYGSEVIGRTMVEAIEFLENPKNQDILLSIMQNTQSKDTIVQVELEPEVVKVKETAKEDIIKYPLIPQILDEDEEKFVSRPRRKGDTL
jgi:hypothetical protein